MLIYILALKSLWSRRYVALLTLLSIAVSVALLLGVSRLERDVHDGFSRTVAGADLLVGPRTGPINLLLYAIFHVGDPGNGVSRKSYDLLASKKAIAWTIPLSLGDSFQGFPVLGTDANFFTHYKYGDDEAIRLAQGRAFIRDGEAVPGAEVARDLGLRPGSTITLSHGGGATSFAPHTGHLFRVVGILAPTGTPVDRTMHVHLDAIVAMHQPPPSLIGVPVGNDIAARADPFSPYALTAFLVGLKAPDTVFLAGRAINAFRDEPLMAVMPAVTLQQLWETVGVAERALLLVSAFVVLTGLLGMMIAMLTSLAERRREVAILRSLGASPGQIFLLLISEALLLALGGIALGIILLQVLQLIGASILADRYGIMIHTGWPGWGEWKLAAMVLAAAALAGLLPAILAYRSTLSDGLLIKS